MKKPNRVISLLLSVLMLLTSIPIAGIMIFADTGASDGDYIIRDDALHFIVRHWHKGFDKDATRQDEDDQRDGDDWFVIVEGYIIQLHEGDDGYEEKLVDENGNPLYDENGNQKLRYYRILLVDQGTGALTPVSTNPTPYITDFDRVTGYLTLAVKPRREENPLYKPGNDEPEYIELERYCGISMSAGRKAVDENIDQVTGETTGFTISYGDGNTHIVKAHVFYNSWNKTVPGTNDEDVFPKNNKEIDTAEVYTWAEGNTMGKPAGDIVKFDDPDNANAHIVCKTQGDEDETRKVLEAAAKFYLGSDLDDLDEDQKAARIDDFIAKNFSDTPTKFYSTKEGLHTNKTLVEEGGTGRLFLCDLEAWYVEGTAADIAFILDASGSMAFTADTPSIVNVYYALANRLGIKELVKEVQTADDEDPKYVVYAYQYTDKETGKVYKLEGIESDAANNYAKLCVFIKTLADGGDLKGAGIVEYELETKDPDGDTTLRPTGNATLRSGFLTKFIETIDDKVVEAFNKDSWDALWDGINAIANQNGVTVRDFYPKRENIIGYYTFDGNSVSSTTHTLDVKTLEKFDGTKQDGDTTVAGDDGYFTLIWETRSKVDANTATWSDYSGTQRISFGGGIKSKGDGNYGSINFATSGPAVVKIWWVSSGVGRQPYIIDAAGDEFARADASTNANAQYSELVLQNAGNYYLGSVTSNIFFFKVEVTEYEVAATDPTLKNNAPNAGSNAYASLVAAQTPGGEFSFGSAGFLSPVKDGRLVIDGKSTAGIKLDVAPKGNFSITFAINKAGSGDYSNKTEQTIADVLYIGAQNRSGDYFRVVRNGIEANGPGTTSRAWLSGYQGEPSNGPYVSAASAFHNSEVHYVTYVFENGKITSYFDGTTQLNITADPLTIQPTYDLTLSDNPCIVLNGFQDNYNGAELYIDNVIVYDTALNSDEVKQLYDARGKNINGQVTEGTVDWNKVFLSNDAALAVLLNPNATAHVELGVAAYNYFVYDGRSGTEEYAPLAYWDGIKQESRSGIPAAFSGTNVLGKLDQFTDRTAGWYYLSHGSDDTEIAALGTAKRLIGLRGGDKNNQPDTGSVRDHVDLPGVPQYESGDGTGATYAIVNNTSVRFYLDGNGNLRSFYSSGNGRAACSYVYELSDNKYVKTEALQRALANFSAELAERSPASKLSAVKFSSEKFKSEELVLLDWTNDPREFAAILSQKRGLGATLGTASGHNQSATNKIEQYNYYLTGGTYTHMGIDAYVEKLAPYASTDEGVEKFLVIVTDGLDDNVRNNKTDETNALRKNIEKLKAEGYTVITIYLPGATALDEDGDIKASDNNYQLAYQFLTSLATTGTEGEYKNKPYFIATSDLSKLKQLFEETIFRKLVANMEDYTVQDYIDPRFDLMEETTQGEIVWHLNADGKVLKTRNDVELETIDVTQINQKTGDYYTIHLTRDCTPTARDPYLLYDAAKDMYYLKWVDQTIPTTPTGSKDLLPVWTAEFLLRAKDDFIGGNAILTNGNETMMNMVYHPYDRKAEQSAYVEKLRAKFKKDFTTVLTEAQRNDYVKKYAVENGLPWRKWSDVKGEDRNVVANAYAAEQVDDTLRVTGEDASSGTADMNRDVDDYYPSKGFPRTTANVRLLPIHTKPIYDVMYLGEAVSPRQMLLEIGDEYLTESYYLDYLKRYAYQIYGGKNETPLLELLYLWLEVQNDNLVEKEFSLPYMYLPNYEYDAETGKFKFDGQLNNIKLNNTGGEDTHEKDVVGILTYRWVRMIPTPGADEYDSAIKDYVKDNTKEVVYSLTVEFTPLRVGDTLEVIEQDAGKKIFAKYVSYEKTGSAQSNPQKEDFMEDDLFDRLQYINGQKNQTASGIQTLALATGDYKLVKESAYKWDPVYKPAAAAKQLTTDPEGIYGDASFANNGRTLQADSTYTKEVVSGGIALELRMMIGELKEALDAGVFEKSFTLTATRTFRDTDYIEGIKKQAQALRAVNVWEDYGDEFTFTFQFAIGDLTDLAATADENGYVSIFTKTENIKVTFGGVEKDIVELPIGTYEFDLKEVNDALDKLIQNNLHFASVGFERDKQKFKTDHFNDEVLNGLNRAKDDVETNPEIGQNNIGSFIAEAGLGTEKVYFYVGTEQNPKPNDPTYNYVPKRGTAAADKADYYVKDRLGMLKLSTGTVRLTIRERGAESSSEKFIYHITGYTLGVESISEGTPMKTVDFYVSVAGNGETTIELLPGNYVIEEIPEWAWKYENKETWGGKLIDKGDDVDITDEQWDIDTSDWLTAKNSLRYRGDSPVEEHKTVTYEHKRNDKTWLGTEGSADNLYDPVGSTGTGTN